MWSSWDSGELKVWLGLEDLLPRWHADMAVGRRPQFLTMWALQGAPEVFGDMAAGFPQSEESQSSPMPPMAAALQGTGIQS